MIYATRLDRTREPTTSKCVVPSIFICGPRSLDASAPRHETHHSPSTKTFVPSGMPAVPASLSNRSSVVPAERRQWTPAVRTIDHPAVNGSAMAPPTHRLRSQHLVPSKRSTVRSGRTPAGRSVRSSTTMRAVSASPPPTLATLCGRPNEPNQPTPPHTTHAESRRTGGTRSSSCSRDATPKHLRPPVSPITSGPF